MNKWANIKENMRRYKYINLGVKTWASTLHKFLLAYIITTTRGAEHNKRVIPPAVCFVSTQTLWMVNIMRRYYSKENR